MRPSEASYLSEMDRRDALYGRHPEKFHFADEEPEPRGRVYSDPRDHPVDGYCERCTCWMTAGSYCG